MKKNKKNLIMLFLTLLIGILCAEIFTNLIIIIFSSSAITLLLYSIFYKTEK